MRMFVRLGAVAAGGVLALAVAAPALADDTISINPGNVPTTAEDFQQICNDFPDAPLPENVDGWHFVTGASGDFTSLTLTFDTPDGEVIVFIDSTDSTAPDTNDDPFWSGFIGEPHNGHAWVLTEPGWTLTDGEATVEEGEGQGQFQLSHTCAGKPDEEPSPSPSPSEPAPSETPPGETPPGETPPGEDDDDEKPGLPVTGLQTGGLVALGVALLAGGAAMLVVRRRRDLAGLVEADE